MYKYIYWFLFSIILINCDAFKILVVFPMPARSHANLGDGVVRNLLRAGHEVTYITPFAYENPPANLRIIDVSSNIELFHPNLFNFKALIDNEVKIEDHSFIFPLVTELLMNTTKNENVQRLLNDPDEQFDVVIVEWVFTDLPAGYATVFNCPLIWVSSVEVHWIILNLIDQPSNPAYTVDVLSPYTPPLTFIERLKELWIQMKVQLVDLYIRSYQDNAYQTLIAPIILKRGREPPSFHEVRYNASLVLGNSYVSMGQATPLPWNYIPIGGYHIEDNLKPLPKDLKKVMDNAKNGVIYFSMGSNLKCKDLPEEIKHSLLEMFGTLKQTVIWKFEEMLPGLPANVHVIPWAPQQEILSHPNLRVFITHGGLLSTTEAIHYGVPIIGIPVFGDQHLNVIKAVNKGFAIKVNLSYKMADKLKEAILEVTTDTRYTETAKKLSFVHRDRPVKPGVELVHWVEHVVRTRGAPHLRSPALYVPYYQKIYLDLAAVIVAILLATLIVLKRVFSLLFSKKKLNTPKKND